MQIICLSSCTQLTRHAVAEIWCVGVLGSISCDVDIVWKTKYTRLSVYAERCGGISIYFIMSCTCSRPEFLSVQCCETINPRWTVQEQVATQSRHNQDTAFASFWQIMLCLTRNASARTCSVASRRSQWMAFDSSMISSDSHLVFFLLFRSAG